MPTPPSIQGYTWRLEVLKTGWPLPIKWERYFIQWEVKEGGKSVLQIYIVQKTCNLPVDAEVFEAIISRLHREYPNLKVLKQAPVLKK